MLALFPLYLSQHAGYGDGTAVLIAGSFSSLAYLASLPGGYLGDGSLGPIRTMLVGAAALTLGAAALMLDRPALLWATLALLVVGHGLFKPNLTALVGKLYRADDSRRESGFAIFYFAVNVGCLFGPLMAEWSRARLGWYAVFASATAMMVPAVVIAAIGRRSVARAAIHASTQQGAVTSAATEHARTRAAVLLCGLAVLSWFAFQQTGGSLILFAQEQTEQPLAIWRWTLPLRPGYYTAFHGGLVLVLLPLMVRRNRRQRAIGKEVSTAARILWGLIFLSAAFAWMGLAGLRGGDHGRVSPLWLMGCYVLLTPGEVWLSAMGLSLLTQLAPKRVASRLVGLWLASVAVGNAVAGAFGLLWTRWPHHRYFAVVAMCCLLGACVLLARMRRLEAIIVRR
jgi:POT family proton-dependent oligopeptide transporter